MATHSFATSHASPSSTDAHTHVPPPHDRLLPNALSVYRDIGAHPTVRPAWPSAAGVTTSIFTCSSTCVVGFRMRYVTGHPLSDPLPMPITGSQVQALVTLGSNMLPHGLAQADQCLPCIVVQRPSGLPTHRRPATSYEFTQFRECVKSVHLQPGYSVCGFGRNGAPKGAIIRPITRFPPRQHKSSLEKNVLPD